MLERKVKSHDWAKRVNLSLFAIIVVDTYLVYSQSTDCEETQKEIYHEPIEELIDNNFDGAAAGGRRPRDNTGVVDRNPALSTTKGVPRSGVDAHLTPTKRMRMRRGEARLLTMHNRETSGFAV
jgi:hypothetical protein